MATLAHVLQLVGGWIGPLVIFLLKRQSRYVSFHALQVLLLQVVFLAVTIIAMMTAIAVGAVLFLTSAHHNPSAMAPMFFLLVPLLWLAILGSWLFRLVIAIVYGIKAGHGEWAEYPVLGRWAREILKIGPNGAAL